VRPCHLRNPAKAHIYLEVFSTSSSGTEGFVVISFNIFTSWVKAKIAVQKLQRAIAESRGQTSDRPLPIALNRATSAEGSYRSGDESATEGKGKQRDTSTAGATATGTTTKRKYRRHPKVSLRRLSLHQRNFTRTSSADSDLLPSLTNTHQNGLLRPMSYSQIVRRKVSALTIVC
jgi:hypothetical protein